MRLDAAHAVKLDYSSDVQHADTFRARRVLSLCVCEGTPWTIQVNIPKLHRKATYLTRKNFPFVIQSIAGLADRGEKKNDKM